MLKKAVQQGRSKRRAEVVLRPVRRGSERSENAAGGISQHPARSVKVIISGANSQATSCLRHQFLRCANRFN